MTLGPDPTGSITVTGGIVTAVDTAQIVGQATVLQSAADLVRSARARCGEARERLRSSPWRWAASVGGFGEGPVLGTDQVAAPGSASARERAAAITAVDTLDAALGELERLLDAVALRMTKASGTYVRSENEVWRRLGVVADVPFVGLEAALVVGQLAFLEGVLTGDGLPWGRLVTGGGPLHQRAVASTGAFVGLLDPDRGPFERPTVANGASVLRTLSEGWRSMFRDDLRVERLGPDRSPGPDLMPPPRSAQDLLRRIDTLYGKQEGNPVPHSSIALEELVHDDGRSTWVVTIPGTQLGLGNLDTPFSMTSNYDLVQGGVIADSTALVLAALEDADVGSEDEVVLVGHSQGGMIAASVAALTAGAVAGTATSGSGSSTAGSSSAGTSGAGSSGTGTPTGAGRETPSADALPRYRVTHVVTAGSPVGGHVVPAGVLGTHVENPQEAISGLDGRDNPAGPNQVTVSRDLDLWTGNDPGAIPHGVEFHVDTLSDAEAIGHPGLRRHLDSLEEALDGTRTQTIYYRGTLELDPGALADRMSPRSPYGSGPLLPGPLVPGPLVNGPDGSGADASSGVGLAPGVAGPHEDER